MNKRLSLSHQAQQRIENFLSSGDVVVDATVGNGHDTLFLAKHVGSKGLVFGFDIQQQAIDTTRSRLESENLSNMVLFNSSHHKMDKYIPLQYHGKIKAIMFNLGYLPGSDKTVITQADSSLVALEKSIRLLAPFSLLTIAAYPGHPGGEQETEQVRRWCKQLDSEHYTVQQINSSEKETAPRLFIVLKK